MSSLQALASGARAISAGKLKWWPEAAVPAAWRQRRACLASCNIQLAAFAFDATSQLDGRGHMQRTCLTSLRKSAPSLACINHL